MRVIETPPIAARWMGHPFWIPAFAGMTDAGGRGLGLRAFAGMTDAGDRSLCARGS